MSTILRNKSLDAGTVDPDRPNRSLRARLRSVRWLPEPEDRPDVYGLHAPRIRKVPSVSSRRLSVACHDRAFLYLYTGVGDFFPVILVTAHNEAALLQFEISAAGRHDPLLFAADAARQAYEAALGRYRRHVEILEKALQNHNLAPGSNPPLLIVQETAEQIIEQSGEEYFLKYRVQTLLEQAVESLLLWGDFKEPKIEVLVTEAGSVSIVTGDSAYRLFYPWDAFEEYSVGAQLDGLNGGRYWDGPYVDRFNFTGYQGGDDFESYVVDDSLDGLNGGNWSSSMAWVARNNLNELLNYDDFESYTVGVELDGLNGGLGFDGPYVDRLNWIYAQAEDDFEAYSVQDPVVDSLVGTYSWWLGFTWVFTPAHLDTAEGWADEDFESYTVEDPLTSTLNGGVYWPAAWSISDAHGVFSMDTFETYDDQDPIVDTLNDGLNWVGPWTIS